ncbi:MAG: HEAT repeat domain-containing protein [Prevotellaceae bacterium]|jgi:hypothetical protein|nr:HEAT repeat domain-containing protein [Prevotellaceae bacterium]
MEDVLYGIDYIDYYLYWLIYTFIGHALIIRICAGFITGCLLIYIALSVWMGHQVWKDRKLRKLRNKVYRQYYKEIAAIAQDTRTVSHEEITARLHYQSRKPPKTQLTLLIIELLAEVTHECGERINEHNYQEIQTVFQVTRFLERTIQFGKINKKITALKGIETINGYASEAVLARIVYHRNYQLRFSARCAYLWLSQGDPFRFLNEDNTINLTLWEAMSLHNGLAYRKDKKHNILHFSKWLNAAIEDNTKRFIIDEIGLFDSYEDVPVVAEYVEARTPAVRADAIRTLGLLKDTKSASIFMEMYAVQPEEVKRAIIHTLTQLPVAGVDTFLYDAYQKEDNQPTRLYILRALYSHEGEGKALFGRLEQQADADTHILFEHIKDPFIIPRYQAV